MHGSLMREQLDAGTKPGRTAYNTAAACHRPSCPRDLHAAARSTSSERSVETK